MSDVSPAAPARRALTGKRAETVQRLADATVETLGAMGYDELTLPAVAAQAGVARATAYTYYSSREHLVAEVYWRRLTSGSPTDTDSPDVKVRVVGVLRYLALVVADEPALGHAIAVALNSPDPDVKLLREEISRYIHRMIATAVGGDGDSKTVLLLELLFTGAIVRAGSGQVPYHEIADMLEQLVLDLLP
ncbi:TetR/AcrR family transcriptional regulator [Nocardia macrotermitis]|uniref:Putative HTH-type transcriptional regulator n=1 Tax=Nocardia macrotermitis TaxID=2585198 RepID=A0A7K0D7G6_9NOCA|nr:TetR/AcrR family transcriptional regulator [Nocardia macrotermitis]MQY21648.1 putative HTH-type transcriptional regulator [Nocardia macrotermitis]